MVVAIMVEQKAVMVTSLWVQLRTLATYLFI